MKTIKNITTLLLLIITGINAGCKKDPVMYSKGFETFKFIVKDGASSDKEYMGVINSDEIVVTLPTEVDVTSLKASFTVDNPRTIVQIGTEVQESGITEQDFTQPINYKIKAEDRSSRTYSVRVEKKIALKTYGFFKEDNPGVLEADYSAVIRGLNIDIAIPETTDLTKLVARFETTAGITLKIGATTQESKKTRNNFSSMVSYTLTEGSLPAPLTFNVNLEFTGPQWFMIGDESIIVPKTSGLKMAINPFTNLPYLAYQRTGKDESGNAIETDNRKIAVVRYNGSGWESVGPSTGITDFRADFPNIAFDNEGTPYIGFRDYFNGDQKSTVLKQINSEWVAVGTKRFTPMKVSKQSFTIGTNNEPLVALISNSTDVPGFPRNALYGTSFTNEKWIANTPGSGLTTGSLQVFTGLDGKTYLAMMDRTSRANLYKLENKNWLAVGPTGFRTADGLPGYTSIIGAVDANGEAYVAYQTIISSERVNRVLKFNKVTSNWEELGSAGNSQGETEKYALAIKPDGTLFFAYANNSGLYFRTYNKLTNNWNNPRTIISGKINEFDMQISSSGIPYLAVSLGSNDKTVVYKYTITK